MLKIKLDDSIKRFLVFWGVLRNCSDFSRFVPYFLDLSGYEWVFRNLEVESPCMSLDCFEYLRESLDFLPCGQSPFMSNPITYLLII